MCSASEHLQEERGKVEARLQLLLEERDLIDRHIAQQKAKQEDASVAEQGIREQVDMISDTITGLQV